MVDVEENSKVAHVKKKSNKTIIATVCVAIILIAAVAGVYYYTVPNQPSDKLEPVTNFSDGAWANYTVNYYDENDTLWASQGSLIVHSTAGTYNGVDCWVYTENDTYTSENGTVINEVVTYNLDKSTFSTLHIKQQIFSNGEVTNEKEFNPGDDGFINDITRFNSMTLIARNEPITVHAGTFSTTKIQGTYTYFVTSETYDMTAWTSADVPAWGVVKYQFYLKGALTWEYLLESYGAKLPT